MSAPSWPADGWARAQDPTPCDFCGHVVAPGDTLYIRGIGPAQVEASCSATCRELARLEGEPQRLNNGGAQMPGGGYVETF